MSNKNKPRAITVRGLKASPRRGPTKTDPRWYWQVYYNEGGKQHRVAGVKSGRYETAELRQVLRDAWAGGKWSTHQDREEQVELKGSTLGLLIDAYLEHQTAQSKRGRIRQPTLDNYLVQRKRLVSLDDILVKQVGLLHLQQTVYQLEDAGYAPSTIRQTMLLVRQAWTHGRARGWVPARDLPRYDLPHPSRRSNDYTPTYDEIFSTRAVMKTAWHRIMLDALTETGARPGEVAVWHWESYRDDDRVLLDGKTGPRWVPMTDRLKASMQAWQTMQDNPVKGPVWPSNHPAQVFRQGLKKACRRAGIPNFTPYGLRRRVSSELIDKMDVARYGAKTYSAWMGHSLQRGMKTYARVSPGRLEEAANVLGEAQGVVNLDAARRRKTGSEND